MKFNGELATFLRLVYTTVNTNMLMFAKLARKNHWRDCALFLKAGITPRSVVMLLTLNYDKCIDIEKSSKVKKSDYMVVPPESTCEEISMCS